MQYRSLNHKGVSLDKEQLEQYLEKLASDHILQNNSSKDTYPIPKLRENFNKIEEVYHLLNEHIKLGIPIHPAGEWLLDNFYIIEETVKNILQELPLKKYKQFLGISNGVDAGFARIYVLAYEIVNYSDNHIDFHQVSNLLASYQKKKTLSMDEIWNIGIFMQIALVQNIRNICEKIYFSQMQKYRVENILERLVEKKEELKYKNLSEYKAKVKGYGEMKYPFIEYLSYRLKMQGRVSAPFIMALEEQVNKMGTSIEEVIKKEHFDIALKKVSMANCITSMKELLRMDFKSIFEQTNGVEEILKQDPAQVYSKMDYRTKEQYRNTIQEISKKTKIAEIYIAKKALSLAIEANEKNSKQSHIGYYLITNEGKQKLYTVLQQKPIKIMKNETKVKIYITTIWALTIILDILCMISFYKQVQGVISTIVLGILILLPLQEIIVQIIQYILGKLQKPKAIPKLDFSQGVPKENATFVVIPTILKSKEKVEELMKKLEVYYLANQSENLYFALLGDCSSGPNKEEPFDKEVIEEGRKQVERLNKKYQSQASTNIDININTNTNTSTSTSTNTNLPKFHFIYRKRYWNGQEESYLGWERKRGLLNQFNEYLLGNEENPFLVNTIEESTKRDRCTIRDVSKRYISYIITLDADTELVLNSGLELIGSMAHILNKPELNEKGDYVIGGHAIMQPRIGITLEAANKNLFTKIFAGTGGIDAYSSAVFDVYQDNFGEGIFTGKGIYDLEVFSKVLKKEIPENMVLSHDLLEGSYLRCGLVSDIVLMDGYPSSYASFKTRLQRWIRGDFQIVQWTQNKIITQKEIKKENPLNTLSRYKITDNLIRALTPIMTLLSFLYIFVFHFFLPIKTAGTLLLLTISLLMPTLLDWINRIIYRKEGQSYQKTFYERIPSWVASMERGILTIMALPDKAIYSLKSICKTIYRLTVSKKHLLEWTTAEEAEKLAKTDLVSYYKNMFSNVIFGFLGILYSLVFPSKMISFFVLLLSILWLISPTLYWYISKKQIEEKQEISKKDKEYLLEIGKKTWQYFKDSMTEENHYLPPDNYQEGRKQAFVNRTSSTNIGLALLSIISSYDLGYENLEDTLKRLNKIVTTIDLLPKWHGHLYNWYNTKTLEPLQPRYISTVDSGNFVGYVYVLKAFYEEIKEQLENGTIQIEKAQEVKKQELLELIPAWVGKPIKEIPMANADFTKLYDEEKELFSIGFNIEENKLTDSYYDLLASEARQASIVAISKKDVPVKHWHHLSRTLTQMNGYNGLISWSGTAFEYLMPNITMKSEKASLLDESCEFMLMLQKEYAKKLEIPWGFSETAFNLKDLNQNYQYKAIGIPWLGLKRGLEEDMVVASYASIMALTRMPKEVLKNIKELDALGMNQKYGFYESIDYTPIRMPKGEKKAIVKTYMAHHQALILLSINNFFSDNILQKRFSSNPEVEATQILLQETMPEKRIITKEEKLKPVKITYQDYENYAQRIYTKEKSKLPAFNVLASDNYTIVMDQRGRGYSKYKNYLVNRYFSTSQEEQGIFFYFKNIKNKRIWTAGTMPYLTKPDKQEVVFSEDATKIKRVDGSIETQMKVTISPEKRVEIRKIELKNHGLEDETIEITSSIEPALTTLEADRSHPAFQNLFLTLEYDEENNIFVFKRKDREDGKKGLYLAVSFYTEDATIGELEYEIDKEKFQGRGNLGLPVMVENSKPFSKKIQGTVDPMLALKRTILLKPEQKASFSLLLSVSEEKEEAVQNVKEYQNEEKIKQAFALSIAKVDTEARYLRLNAKQIEAYQKLLGYLLFTNPIRGKYRNNLEDKKYPQSDLWQYGISGDYPILLVKITQSNEAKILEDVLKAFEFFRLKNIAIDLVILNEEPNSYEKYTKESILNSILNVNLGYLQNAAGGGIFILDKEDSSSAIEFYAKFVLDTKKGPLIRQLKDLEEEYLEEETQIGEKVAILPTMPYEERQGKPVLPKDTLHYENEYGGFSADGKEYHLAINKENRLPTVWSHIMANETFGTLVTDSMGGFTWSKNSRLNRISSWSNNQVLDIPSEVFYLQDAETLKTWSLGLNPMPDSKDYHVTYGFGYSIYEHESEQIKQKVTIFVPRKEEAKISLLELKNLEPRRKKINLIYYIKPVLGEDEEKTKENMKLKFYENANMICVENKTNVDFDEKIYVTSSQKIISYTGSREFFFGKGNLSSPEGIKKVQLNKEDSLGKEAIIALEMQIELEAYESKEISFVIGAQKNLLDCQDKAYQYSKIANIQTELEEVKKYWQDLLGKVQVETPMKSFDILMNGWLIYQTIASRLYARSAFYQSGGAYGFRDQLQDTICVKYFDSSIMKNQIIKHSEHQFIEGDVEHWWHEETSRGIRTRFSDDLLWLVYLVEDYINFTNDTSILDVETSFLQGATLENGVDENYDVYETSKEKASIFEHCERALEKSFVFGENNLPKIGSGDWNDGFSKVGNKGKGESVWLGFFLYDILKKWIPICEEKVKKLKVQESRNNNEAIKVQEDEKDNEAIKMQENEKDNETIKIQEDEKDNEAIKVQENEKDNEAMKMQEDEKDNEAMKMQEDEKDNEAIKMQEDEKNNETIKMQENENKNVTEKIKDLQSKIAKYKEIMQTLKKALNTSAWDGRWYKRAFMDTGEQLGTIQNEECKIDGIAQSWATISGAGDNDKKYISIESLENHLVDKENGIIKLLDPPFEKSNLDPGYIKAYLPGTRENGGQYTHAAIWAIMAEAILGFGDKALEYFRMINPIEHSRTKEAALKYKVEPYVVAADIYGQGNLAGRGGWTWYTGSSSWLYEAGLHYILGLTIEKGYLSLNPCIPSIWKEYKIHYKYKNTIYNIEVKNPNAKNTGVETMIANGEVIEEKKVHLEDNGKINTIEIYL